MSQSTGIEWTDATWNPVEGCTMAKGSETGGCLNCYAARQALRRPAAGLAVMRESGPRWTGKVHLVEKRLTAPLHWRKPQRIFVNSMSDLFHESLPARDIDKVFAVMSQSPQHTFQVLTKREDTMLGYITSDRTEDGIDEAAGQFGWCHSNVAGRWPLPNVWLGVSVENRENLHRIDTLRKIPAAMRFLSLEPLLEDLGKIDLTGIDWVIVGGESGPGARSCQVEWIRTIVRQCSAANVAAFVKQFGANPRVGAFRYYCEDDPRKGGNPLDWPHWARVREFPATRKAVA